VTFQPILLVKGMSGTGFTSSHGFASGDSSGSGSGRSHVRVPWYDYEDFQELSGRTFYNESEVKERFIAWINTQNERHYQLKIGTKKTIPMVSPWIEDVSVREKDVLTLKKAVYKKIGRSLSDVKSEVEGRVTIFLDSVTIEDEHIKGPRINNATV